MQVELSRIRASKEPRSAHTHPDDGFCWLQNLTNARGPVRLEQEPCQESTTELGPERWPRAEMQLCHFLGKLRLLSETQFPDIL